MKYYLIAISLFLLACSEEQQPESISLEELAGETGAEEEVFDTTRIENTDLPAKLDRFVQGQISLYSTAPPQDAAHPIDRFGYSNCHKIAFHEDLTKDNKMALVHPAAVVFYYGFADTTSTKNAFYNWLDCFGRECISVRLNEDLEEIDAEPIYALVYDTCIVSLETWRSEIRDSLLASFGKNYNYCFEVTEKRALKWKPTKDH